MNYFDLFGLPTAFELDGSLLSSAFRTLQKQCHPDNFATHTESERLAAVQKAAQINDGYQALKNPISRAEHLLALQNIQLDSEQHTLQDTDFLMTQLELREELEQLERQQPSLEQLTEFEQRVKKMHQHYLAQVEQQLQQSQWLSAADSVRKLKFITKLTHEIARVEEQIFN